MQIGLGIGIPQLLSFKARGSGSIYDPASDAIFAAFTTPPTTARKALIDAAVVALKAAGVWAKLDVLYAFAAADSQAGLVNWVQPGTYNATLINSPAFVADQGFTGAATKHIDSGFNLSSSPAPKYLQNSGSLFGWAFNATVADGGIVGTSPVASGGVAPRHSDGNAYARVNSTTTNIAVGSSGSVGFWCASRTTSILTTLYKNGISIGTSPTPSMAIASQTFTALVGIGNYYTGQCSWAGIGAGLDATEQLALYNALAAYMAGLATDRIAAAFTTPPSAARKTLIQNCVTSLMQAGVWDKLDALYAFAAADRQAAIINWKAPGTYNASEVNSPTFTADQGFTGANTKYLDSGFSPGASPTPKWTINSACAFAWSNSNVQAVNGPVGDAVNATTLLIRHTTDVYSCRINCTTAQATGANTDGSGFWLVQRIAVNDQRVHKNSVFQSSQGGTSSAPTTGNMWFLRAGADYWPGQAAWGGFGSHLSNAEITALYNALAVYMVGLAGVTLEAETLTIIAGMTAPPTPARRISINNAVVALKAGGVWSKLDALYCFAAADSQAAIINWKAPGTYNATLVNSPTFTADAGFTGASAKYLNTGFNPTTAPSPKFTQDSACAFGFLTAVSSSGIGLLGTTVAGPANGNTTIYPNYAGNTCYFLITQNPNTSVASTNTPALWSVNRSAASATQIYRNGVSHGTSAQASTPTANGNFLFCRQAPADDLIGGMLSAGGIGSSLNGAEQSALYNALAAYMAGLATDRIAAAFTTPPTAGRKTLIQNCVTSLMQAGVWAKLDALYVMAAADSQAAIINWKQPGTYNATEVNSPAFTADRGFTGNGTTSYIDSGFNATTAPLPKYTLNSASVFAWNLTNVASAGSLSGQGGNITNLLIPRYTDDTFISRINCTASNVTVASTNSIGLWSADRSGPTTSSAYKNGSSVGTNAAVTAALVNSNTTFLFGNGSYLPGQIASGGFGASLTAAEHLALYNALRAYMTGVGVP